MKRREAVLVSGVLSLCLSATAEERVDEEMIARIKMEAFQRSRVMETVAYLTDVHGPRLTGSPNLKSASLWARDRLASWGLADPRLEAWGRFGRGWSIERFSVGDDRTPPTIASWPIPMPGRLDAGTRRGRARPGGDRGQGRLREI
jgi:hypothetical protein